jgi:hypothetical protein
MTAASYISSLYWIHLFPSADRKCFGMSQAKESQLGKHLSTSTSRTLRWYSDLLNVLGAALAFVIVWAESLIPFYGRLYSLILSAFLSFSWIFWIWCVLRCIKEYQIDYRLGLYLLKVNILHVYFPRSIHGFLRYKIVFVSGDGWDGVVPSRSRMIPHWNIFFSFFRVFLYETNPNNDKLGTKRLCTTTIQNQTLLTTIRNQILLRPYSFLSDCTWNRFS